MTLNPHTAYLRWRYRRATKQAALKWVGSAIEAMDIGDHTSAISCFKHAAETYLRAHLNIAKLDIVDIAIQEDRISLELADEFDWLRRVRDAALDQGVSPTKAQVERAAVLVETMRDGTTWEARG